MRGRDGRLKILDFGLALIERTPTDGTVSPRVTQPGRSSARQRTWRPSS